MPPAINSFLRWPRAKSKAHQKYEVRATSIELEKECTASNWHSSTQSTFLPKLCDQYIYLWISTSYEYCVHRNLRVYFLFSKHHSRINFAKGVDLSNHRSNKYRLRRWKVRSKKFDRQLRSLRLAISTPGPDRRPYERLLKIVKNINHRKKSHLSQKVTRRRKKSHAIAKSQTHPQMIAKSQPPVVF